MKPLQGATVIDFTQAYSGPYCTVNLADYGARVIKIERPETGDQTRYWGPLDENGKSGYFAMYNRNKESIAIDLSRETGREIVRKLVKEADIVVDNFRTGTLEKLGLGYEELKKIKPEIIHASLTGYGQYGPLKKLAAYDNIIEGTCGLMDCTGFPDGGPVRSGCSVGDSYTGLMTNFAITTAYYHKLRTGEGQRIDVAMQDALLSSVERAFLEYAAVGQAPRRDGNRLGGIAAPYDVYRCRDGWFSVAVVSEAGWQEFCANLGQSKLAEDPCFVSNEQRLANVEALSACLEPFFLARTQEELTDLFTCRYFGAASVMDGFGALADPHLLSREMVVEIDDANVGRYKGVGVVIKFSKTPGSIEKGSPLLGEHTRKILTELGYSEEQAEHLIAGQIVEAAGADAMET